LGDSRTAALLKTTRFGFPENEPSGTMGEDALIVRVATGRFSKKICSRTGFLE
jgi:hypothetical protein